MRPNRPRVFYHSHANEDLYALIRDAAGSDFEVVTLERDDDAERTRKLGGCEAVIVAAYRLGKHHLDAAPNLRIVHHQGVGWHDTTDWREIKRRGLPLALAPEGTAVGVSEHAVLMMLAAAKRLPFVDAEIRKGRWHVNTFRSVSRELYGKTIGYVGMGRIGNAVAERLVAFGCSGIYVDPYVTLPPERAARLGVRKGTLAEVLAAADVLTIHCPVTDETRDMINAETLAQLKPGAIVVNTARGGIVNELALADALKSGHVLAAAVDVLEKEPPGAEHPLFALDNVVLTPHIAAGTRDAMRQKLDAVFANLRRFWRNEPLINQVMLP